MSEQTKNSEIKLLGCPMCGGKAEVVDMNTYIELGYHVHCKKRCCWSRSSKIRSIAIKRWNTRTKESK